MAKYNTLGELFSAIATSLRGKTGGSGKIIADDFPTVIDSLSTGGITPSGTKTITSNGSHDVTNYATAQVNVPASGITPSGTKTITENGTHDVTSYASALVNVPAPAQKTVVRTVTLNADVTGAGATTTLLSNDAFIKEHYAHSGFSAMWYMNPPVASATGTVHFNYHGNKNVGSSDVSRTGVALKSSSTSAIGLLNHTTAINGKGYNVHMRVDSSGNLMQYLASGSNLKAGTYTIILTCINE